MINLRNIRLPRRTESVAAARAAVGDLAESLGPRSDDAELLVSELVTNALKYGRGDIQLSISTDRRALRIVVSDDGGTTTPVLSDDPGQGGGWGLHLVDRLADRWGIVPRTSHVWFELTLPDLRPLG